MATELGSRVKDIVVLFKPGDELKQKAGTSFTPRGLVRGNGHRILMHEKIGKYDEVKTFAHEVMHCLDDQWFTDAQRLEIAALMDAPAAKWDAKSYNERAYEAFACYGSAALGGFDSPPYTEFYDRTIAKPLWPTVAATALKDFGPATPAPEPEPTPTDPKDDEIAALKLELGQKRKLLEELATGNDEGAAAQLTLANKARTGL
jgi:hypothetical protein